MNVRTRVEPNENLSFLPNPDNGFLCWQREERREGGSGFDGIELIGGYGGQEMQESI
jgi:hypothetical protein